MRLADGAASVITQPTGPAVTVPSNVRSTAPGSLRVEHGSQAAAVAVGSVFAVNGLLVGAYAAVLPALRDRLGIDARTLSVLLLVVGFAAVCSMQVGGRLADRWGARGIALGSLPVMTIGAVVIALATELPLVLVGGALVGVGNGACDVAMNAVGVEVEKARPVPVMSRFHAFWSIGTFSGPGSSCSPPGSPVRAAGRS